MRIVVKVDSSILSKTEWTFYVNGSQFILDSYIEYTRATSRHTFRPVEQKKWLRLNARYSTLATAPVPSLSIMRQAMQQFANDVVFTDQVRVSEAKWNYASDMLNFKVRTE